MEYHGQEEGHTPQPPLRAGRGRPAATAQRRCRAGPRRGWASTPPARWPRAADTSLRMIHWHSVPPPPRPCHGLASEASLPVEPLPGAAFFGRTAAPRDRRQTRLSRKQLAHGRRGRKVIQHRRQRPGPGPERGPPALPRSRASPAPAGARRPASGPPESSRALPRPPALPAHGPRRPTALPARGPRRRGPHRRCGAA